jgi:tetratricopeptide (TPR) repeat protein
VGAYSHIKPAFVLLIFYASVATASAISVEEGKTLFARGDFTAAKSIFQALQQENPAYAGVNFHLAKSHIKERNFTAAIKHLDKSLEIDNSRADAHYLLGIAYVSLLGEVNIFKKLSYANKAKKAWEAALRLDNNHLQSRFALTSYLMNAPGIAGGDMDEAEKQIKIISSLHEGYGALASAIYLEKNDRAEEAENLFAKAVNNISDRAGPLFNQANFYTRQERYDEALATLEAYVGSDTKSWDDPADLFVHILRARIRAGMGDTTSAKKELQQALALKPSNSIHKFIETQMADL